MAIDTAAGSLDHLDHDIQKVEFKVTVVTGEEGKAQDLLPGAGAKRRVYFYDTTDLALFRQHLVLRARVTEGDEDDSTVKLRPVDLKKDDAVWREIEGIRVELDVVGAKHVPSAKLDGDPDLGEIEAVAAGQRSVDSLFSKKQEKLIDDYKPHGVSLDGLEVLGPVEALVWADLQIDGFPHRLGIEKWTLPNDTHFYELSFKVSRDDARAADVAFRRLLDRLGITIAAEQVAKTEQVLKVFADRLP